MSVSLGQLLLSTTMGTLIAEDLLLLLLDDAKGTTPAGTPIATVLGGAVLLELALDGAVSIDEHRSRWRSQKVRAVDVSSSTDPVLTSALHTIAEKERSAQNLVSRLGKELKPALGDRLAKRGVLERRDTTALGLIPQKRWTVLDSSRKQHLRQAITTVLVHQQTPDERTGALIALLSAVDRAHRTVGDTDVPKREIKRRAKQISKGAWAADAVRDAIAAATTAITAATITSAAASSGGG
jgi:hypothetical protein